MNEGLEALNRISKFFTTTRYDKDLSTIEKELKDKEKFEELVNMDLDLFMKSVDIKGLIEDYQKFKKTLEIIKDKKVDVDYFIYTCVVDDWSYEDYLEEYNSHSRYICGQYSFDYQGKEQPLLTREEYDLLKEMLL